MENFSLTDIKKKNRLDVFHHIYGNPGCSKQNIANALNMSLPTVTQHLSDLKEQELIENSGQLSSSIGRKAAAYSVSASAKAAIGVEILSNRIYITAVDLYGHVLAKEKEQMDFDAAPSYFEGLKDSIFTFLETHQLSKTQILGIGLGIQGLTSSDGSSIIYGEILKTTGLSMDKFQSYFSVPCRFVHDAECAANSELWENPTLNNAIYLSLGQHFGGAVILDGKLQRGLTGKTGTFEHMTLVPGGRLCYCGKKGCAESYCSAAALLENGMELEDFFEAKEGGDAACEERWKEYLSYLAVMINNLHMVFESDVILGGHITPFIQDSDLTVLQKAVYELSTFRDDTSYIQPGRCRNDAVSIGAALPFINEFLRDLR